MPVASATTTILLAFGAALFAMGLLAIAIFASLDQDDRRKLRTLARHPLRTIFAPDEPDADED